MGVVGPELTARSLGGADAIPGTDIVAVAELTVEAAHELAMATLVKWHAEAQLQPVPGGAGITVVVIFFQSMFEAGLKDDRPHLIGPIQPQHRPGLDRAHAVEFIRAFEPVLAILAHIAGTDVHAQTEVLFVKRPAHALVGIEKNAIGADDLRTQRGCYGPFVTAAVTWHAGCAGP